MDWSDETARHRLHDLARLFAAARMTEEERSASQMRHAAHYLGVLREAQNLYLQGSEAIKRGLALFDLEWRNIQAGQSWAEKQSGENDASSLCNYYPDAGAYLLDLRLHPREQIRWREAALAAARRLKNRAAEGVHLGNLGAAYVRLGETRRAIEFFEQQLAINREIGYRRGESNALFNTSLALDKLGDRAQAIAYAEAALEIYELIESPDADDVRKLLAQWRGQE